MWCATLRCLYILCSWLFHGSEVQQGCRNNHARHQLCWSDTNPWVAPSGLLQTTIGWYIPFEEEPSLDADKLKAEKKPNEDEMNRQEEARKPHEEEERKCKEEELKEAEAKQEALRHEAAKRLSEEPPETCQEPVSTLRFRCPDREILTRRFFADQPLTVAFEFLTSKGHQTPCSCKVLIQYPRRSGLTTVPSH